MLWLKSANLYAMLALVLLGGAIVGGIFRAGERHNQMKHDSDVAAVNAPIVEQRGRDEAELAAERDAASRADAVVAEAVTQTCILTPDTAKLLASVK